MSRSVLNVMEYWRTKRFVSELLLRALYTGGIMLSSPVIRVRQHTPLTLSYILPYVSSRNIYSIPGILYVYFLSSLTV
jgi:hypothetical protein